MTEQPVAPAPAAPAPAPAAAPPAVPASATDPAAEVARLQAELDKARGHSRTWEERAKANENAAPKLTAMEQRLAEIAKHVGLPDAAPDPEAVVRQLQAAQAEKAQLARERAVLLAAPAVGANAAALLDSRGFAQQLAAIDPTDSAAIQAAIQAAIAANPLYAATPAAPPAPAPRQASAAGQFGQPAGNAQWTADDVAKASPEAVAKAMREGRLASYMAS